MTVSKSSDRILVLDFGAQYAHLICRRIRELGVYAELVPHTISPRAVQVRDVKGLILSGSPASVYEPRAPRCAPGLFHLGRPILGICYGLQLMVHMFGGQVAQVPRREYGPAALHLVGTSALWLNVPDGATCWMSHGDAALHLPPRFQTIARTPNSPFAAIAHTRQPLYAVQFHPEVSHTVPGRQILRNFLFEICKCRPSWSLPSFVEQAIRRTRRRVGQARVLCAVSGGIDSTTTAALVHRAIGPQVTCVFVDHGLLRKGEAAHVKHILQRRFGRSFLFVDGKERFLARLAGMTDPEAKRRVIGQEFVRLFHEVSARHGPFTWLAQGTLYPDVIESGRSRGPAARIKTHHNVGGLPPRLRFRLLEPLRELYKDEVRSVARLLKLPTALIHRHPFPGPGLAVRILGEVTPSKLALCRAASAIVEEELAATRWYDRVWQAFAIVGDDRAVGVTGDARREGYVVTVRVVQSDDGMTADWVRLPATVLSRISTRITNELPGVAWVTYAISSKPPATIEPQ